MSEPYDKLAYAEEFERLAWFRRNYLDRITAEIQEAAGESVVRRVADPQPTYPGNRHQRRAAARNARQRSSDNG